MPSRSVKEEAWHRNGRKNRSIARSILADHLNRSDSQLLGAYETLVHHHSFFGLSLQVTQRLRDKMGKGGADGLDAATVCHINSTTKVTVVLVLLRLVMALLELCNTLLRCAGVSSISNSRLT